jgi:hypothetical protein
MLLLKPSKRDLSRRNRINLGDAWSLQVAEYAFSELPQVKGIRKALNNKKNTVKDSGATYRQINHWAKTGLIEDKSRKSAEGWRRLSFLDLVWIQVIVELRRYGVPLELLKIARSAIFEVPDKPGVVRPEFEYAIANCLVKNPRAFLVVFFSDGSAEVTDEATLELSRTSTAFNPTSYLVVDLNHCCRSLSPKTPLPGFRVKPTLSDEELSVIESVRSGKYDVVEVHRRDGEIDIIKCRSKKQAAAKKLDVLVRKMEFGEFSVKVQKRKVVVTQVSEWRLPDEIPSLLSSSERTRPSLDNKKHRRSWQKLLAALCMKALIDYRKRGADAKLRALTERFAQPIDRKTIKGIVGELRDNIKWQETPPET